MAVHSSIVSFRAFIFHAVKVFSSLLSLNGIQNGSYDAQRRSRPVRKGIFFVPGVKTAKFDRKLMTGKGPLWTLRDKKSNIRKPKRSNNENHNHSIASSDSQLLENLLVPTSTLNRNVDLWSGGSITKACEMRRLLPIITC